MPIFEYKCGKCGSVFEVLQTKSKAAEKCEKCGAKARKLPASRVGFVFKGSGFYVNDYSKKSGAPESKPKVEAKTETAPAKSEKTPGKQETKKQVKKESKGAK
jgi:putative FmdB family regulatory protein